MKIYNRGYKNLKGAGLSSFMTNLKELAIMGGLTTIVFFGAIEWLGNEDNSAKKKLDILAKTQQIIAGEDGVISPEESREFLKDIGNNHLLKSGYRVFLDTNMYGAPVVRVGTEKTNSVPVMNPSYDALEDYCKRHSPDKK